jgi:flavin-binding protein dodecin
VAAKLAHKLPGEYSYKVIDKVIELVGTSPKSVAKAIESSGGLGSEEKDSVQAIAH